MLSGNAQDNEKSGMVTDPALVSDTTGITFDADISPSFPGGNEGWRKFFLKKLRLEKIVGGSSADQRVLLQFAIDTKGKISDITVVSDVNPSLTMESIRIIKLSPSWIPAQKNGKNVKVYWRQPVTLVANLEDAH